MDIMSANTDCCRGIAIFQDELAPCLFRPLPQYCTIPDSSTLSKGTILRSKNRSKRIKVPSIHSTIVDITIARTVNCEDGQIIVEDDNHRRFNFLTLEPRQSSLLFLMSFRQLANYELVVVVRFEMIFFIELSRLQN